MGKSPSRAASIGGKARAQKLSKERRREIALQGAKASMKKAGRDWESRRKKPSAERAMEEKTADLEQQIAAATEVLLDPIAWIHRYLIHSETGMPFVLYPAEELFLREALTPDPNTLKLKYDEVIFSAPKKSGKTALAAMALLYVIIALGGDRAEGYIVSNSREQAADRIFADCTSSIKASPELAEIANPRNDLIEFPEGDKFIKTVTTEAKSAAGPRPTIVVGDEIWGFTSEASKRLWDEMAPTPTVPVSLRLITTYAGFAGESELLEGYYQRIFAEDGSLQEGVEKIGEDLYRKGRLLVYWTHECKAPWQTPQWIETMRQAYASRPNQYKRIMENRWVAAESNFIEPEYYERCVDKALKRLGRAPHLHVVVAVDASVKKDSTAIVTVAADATEVSETKTLLEELRASPYAHPNPLIDLVAALPWKEDFDDSVKPPSLADLRVKLVDDKIIVPGKGRPIDFSEIERYIIGLSKRFHVELVCYDPYQMVSLAQGLSRFGVPMFELTQTLAHATAFTELLSDLITQRRYRTYPAAELRTHILNAAAKESERGFRLIKRSKNLKVDGAVALAMACYGLARSFNLGETSVDAPVGGDIYAV